MKRKLILAASLATAGALAVAGTVMADDRDWPNGGMRGGRGHRPFVAGIIVVALAAAVVAVVVWLLLRRRTAASAAPVAAAPMGVASPTAHAEAILAERLARSEITPDDYRVALAALRESATGAAPVAPWSPVPTAPVVVVDDTTPEGDANS